MVSSIDSLDVPPGFVSYIQNADFSSEIGTTQKSPGFDRHSVDNPLPDNFPPPLSMGWFTYTRVWSGTEEVNDKVGRFVVQTNGSPGGAENNLDYYWREYDFESALWDDWSEHQSTLDYGTTKADRIRWSGFEGILRGACGNESDSYPLWFGYVNRNKNDSNGFFHDYTHTGENGDYDGFTGVIASQDLPTVKYGISRTGDGVFTDVHNAIYGNEVVRYIAIPIYDGHQVCSPNQAEAYSPTVDYWVEVNYGTDNNFQATRLLLDVDWSDEEKMVRLSGFNIYESRALEGEYAGEGLVTFSPWTWIRYVDIQSGSTVSALNYSATYESTGTYLSIANANLPSNCFDDLWVHIRSKTTVVGSPGTANNPDERYKITSTTKINGTTRIAFTPHPGTLLADGAVYYISILEHWDEVPGETDKFRIHLFVDGNSAVGEAPWWLPDPNRLDDDSYSLPTVSCNYRCSGYFLERHFVGNVYYDGVKYPLMIRWSNPTNDPLAGHDLYPNYLFIPSDEDDEVMGFAQTLNVLSIFTRKKIFKYVFEGGIPVLQETPYHVGLYASDSLITHNGIHWFFGIDGQILSKYKYDGIRKPRDVGKKIRDQIDARLAVPYVQPSQIIGWYDTRTSKYKIAINTYTDGDIWYSPGSPGSPGRID
jgi:hypothetical protein